jgi:hypothetical protein
MLKLAFVATLTTIIGAAGPVGGAAAQQHIWLHYDYMVGADGTSYAPSTAAIAEVVQAFSDHGIQLEVDPQHTRLPYHALLDFGSNLSLGGRNLGLAPQDVASFHDLKAQYLHPTSNHDWHYAIFGDLSACNGQSGIAVQPGLDFVVTLGALRRLGIQLTPEMEGGTFMHELGHNLGLGHGGANQNWESNYLSVMNYRFQYGIAYSASAGSTSIFGRKLDYSEEALPTLNEAHLDESAGLGATLASDRADITSWTNPGPGPFALVGSASGALDWNHDGAIERDVAVDLDNGFNTLECGDLSPPFYPTCPGSQLFEPQKGFDDWSWIHAYLAGSVSPGPKTFEHENAAAEPFVSSVSPAAGPQAGGSIVLISGAHFEKTTTVTFGGTAATVFTVVNDNTISAIVPPGTGSVDVTVVSGDNPSPSISSDQFTYLAPPVVGAVSPSSGLPGTLVTVTGSHLSDATAVDFGASPAATFNVVDDTTLTAVAPAAVDGVVVTVAGPGGTSSINPVGATFTYLPQVTSVSPDSGPAGTQVTIRGSSFNGAFEVCFGQYCVVPATVVDDATISVQAPPFLVSGSTVDVTVTTQAGTSAIDPGCSFTAV